MFNRQKAIDIKQKATNKVINNQKAFDLIYKAIVDQGKPSINISTLKGCFYREYEGDKCSIGHLLSDEDYKTEYDDVSHHDFGEFIYVYIFSKSLWDYDVSFLEDMQRIHDNNAYNNSHNSQGTLNSNFLEDFKNEMKEYARKHGLIVPLS